jgi:hypothetical protein
MIVAKLLTHITAASTIAKIIPLNERCNSKHVDTGDDDTIAE